MSADSNSALLSSRCQLPDRTLWFGRALLYNDRVTIRGWCLSGRYRQVVPIERICNVQWRVVPDDVNFILHLDGGGAVPMQLRKEAGIWNAKLHALLGKSVLEAQRMAGTSKPVAS